MFGAVDIGGSKTLVAVLNGDGQILEEIRFVTPKKYESFIGELADAVAKLSTADFGRVVVAVPGRLDRKHGVGLAFGNLDWVKVPIEADLEKVFDSPVVIENDSKLAALAEAQPLRDQYRKVLYVTVSTGISAGIVIDGELDRDFEDIEPGHMLLEHQGHLMDWEDFASGRAFQKKFGKKVGDVAADEDQAWSWLARNLAVGLLDLAATLTPDVIVMGGGAGLHLDKYGQKLHEILKSHENPMFRLPPIVGARLGDQAVIYGCYELAKQHHAKRHLTHQA